MNSAKKAYISFLMSVFLMSGIAALAYIGVFNFRDFSAMPTFVKAIAFVAVFSTLFFLVSFLFNLKRRSSRKKKAVTVEQEGNREPRTFGTMVRRPSGSVEVPAGVTQHQNGLLAAASSLSPSSGINETPRQGVIYEKNGIPYINSDLAKNNQKNLDSNFVKLVESVTSPLPPPVLRQQDKP